MNITLIGFMASGKSTLARKMAQDKGMQLISIDDEIVKVAGMPINEIFKIKGEEYFRAIERAILKNILNKDNQIIDCGGGAAIYNRELIKDNSYVIFVNTDYDIIWNRLIEDKSRPLAMDKSYEELKELYEERLIIYEEIADEKITC